MGFFLLVHGRYSTRILFGRSEAVAFTYYMELYLERKQHGKNLLPAAKTD